MTGPVPTATTAPYTVGTLNYTRLGLAMLFFWLLGGAFCFMLMESLIPNIVPLQLAALHASNETIGAIMTVIPTIIAVLTNPIISFQSDRFRSRWGRRIPFIFVTIPPLVLSVIGLGYGRIIGSWLHRHLGGWTSGESQETTIILTIGGLMMAFSFFNMFVNSAFWYLFNDVVPLHLLARFSAWFQVVTLTAASIFNFVVFQYWDSHGSTIFLGGGLVYFFGFGLMCLRVKEGKYPPPPANVDGKSGAWSSIKTYARECHRKIYILVFCTSAAQAGVWSSLSFLNLFYEATGLSREEVGEVNGTAAIAGAVFYIGAGWLADRYHPLRVTIIGLIFQIFIASPAQFYWLLAKPSPHGSFVYWMFITILLVAPAAAMIGALGVVYMRLFPKTRYGQFCSANVIWRSTLQIASGLLVGYYFDALKARFGSAGAYLWLPAYQLVFYLLMLGFSLGVYILWKKHGGDAAYRPPGFEHEEQAIRAHDHEPGYVDHAV